MATVTQQLSKRAFLGSEVLTVSSTSVSLASTLKSTALLAMITVKSADIAMNPGGVAVVGTNTPVSQDSIIEYDADLTKVQFIRLASTDATLYVDYYGN